MNTFPMLYHKGKAGAIFSWRVWADKDEIFTEHGQIDGKKQIASKSAAPKNVGRANATSSIEQAEKEAASMWTFKKERKYSETIEGAKVTLSLPMLAHKFDDHRKKVTFPCDVQPKLDGYRCIARWEDGEVRLFSRSGKSFVLPHIAKELEPILPQGTELDGELYLTGVSFQTLGSWIKKQQPESEKIEYHCYDMPMSNNDDTLSWKERDLERALFFAPRRSPGKVHFVETHTVQTEVELLELVATFVSDGMEGGIVRLHDGKYQYGYRSHELLKVKNFEDAEFKLVDWTSGTGKFADCCIWICETADGKRFNAVPKGTLEFKRQLLKEAQSYMGEMLKVQFFGKSNDGIPRFSVGLGVRISEDIS